MYSRSLNPKIIIERAPISIPPVANATRWEEILFISVINTLIAFALSGTSMPISFSVVNEKTNSLKSGDR